MVGPGGVDRMDYLPFGGLARSVSGGTVRYLFTGQEFDENTGLHNFRARLYDPAAGRFLSVDPAGQFHSPYSYAGGNPVSVIDPNGEFAFTAALIGAAIGAAVGGASYTAHAAITGSDWSLGGFAFSAGMGALQGALSGGFGAYEGLSVGQQFLSEGVGAASSYLPSESFEVAGVSVALGPSFAYGTHGFRLGANVSASGEVGGVTLSAGYSGGISQGGAGSSMFDFGGFQQEFSYGAGYSTGKFSAYLGATTFTGGGAPQTVGTTGLGYGRFSIRSSNDVGLSGGHLGDRGDRYRTAAVQLRYKVDEDTHLSVGFSLLTGDPGPATEDGNGATAPIPYSSASYYTNETNTVRMGALYVGFRNGGNAYRLGGESDAIRNWIQNPLHYFVTDSPLFLPVEDSLEGYTRVGSYNPFSLY